MKTLTESPEKVVLFDGTELTFDYLMICSGSSYTPPIKVSIGDNNKKSLTEDLKGIKNIGKLLEKIFFPIFF